MLRRRLATLRRDRRGAAALEFALVAPTLILFIIGIAQLGILFYANAGLGSAVAEGARYATIYPRPSTTEIQTRITSSRFGLTPSRMSTPAISYGQSNGVEYADISATYSVPVDFIFFSLPDVTLTKNRRAFTY